MEGEERDGDRQRHAGRPEVHRGAELREQVRQRDREEVVILEVAEQGQVGDDRQAEHDPLRPEPAGSADQPAEAEIADRTAEQQDEEARIPEAIEYIAGGNEPGLLGEVEWVKDPGDRKNDGKENGEINCWKQHDRSAAFSRR